MDGDARTETGAAQVDGGLRAVDKLGAKVEGEAVDRYIIIRNIV